MTTEHPRPVVESGARIKKKLKSFVHQTKRSFPSAVTDRAATHNK